MTITPERLAAFADGELPEAEARLVEAQVAQDPDLARQVAAHRALRQRLAAHFAPILNAPLPDHLVAPLVQPDRGVVDITTARERRETRRDTRRGVPRWTWIAGPALAASLVLAIMLPVQDKGDAIGHNSAQADESLADRRLVDGKLAETRLVDGRAYAANALAQALSNQLSADQPASAETRILLSFKDSAGTYCRAFSGKAESGIACRDQQGWQLRKQVGGASGTGSDYRQAGNPDIALMTLAQDMAPEGALDASQEQAAKAKGWQ